MCGIIGILGKAPVAPLLLDGLKRLEYRGYDSAGVATLVNGSIERRRAEGKLANLASLLDEEPVEGTIGIGHTRWATHGQPTETNAHPHASQRVAVVHNGIIENFQELRGELEEAGHVFETETDTEVVVHLLTDLLDRQMSPEEATQAALGRLEGAFALAIVFAGRHDLMIGARRGSPLAVGYGDGEMYLGSDALALAPLTNRICYLEEGDWAVLGAEGAEVRDETGATVAREVKQTAVSGALIGKGQYRHFMQKEIFEQPAVIGDTLQSYLNPLSREIQLPELPFDFAKLPRMTISACGTAFYSGLVAKYWLEGLARLPVEIDIASEFRYREAPLPEGGASLFVSQSGETIDTLAALRYAREQDQHIVSVVNVPESAIARESDLVLPTLAGPEIGVASTKAFTTQLTVLCCLALAAARTRGAIDAARANALSAALTEVPSRIAEVLNHDEAIRGIAAELAETRDVLYLRPRLDVSAGPGRRAQAQGDQLHPCRGLRRRRDEARAHCADRRDRAGDRLRPLGPAVREDGLQRPGDHRARRPGDPLLRRGRCRQARPAGCAHHRATDRRRRRGADPLRGAGAAARLPHGGDQGHGRRPAPEPGEVGDGGVGAALRLL